MAGYDRLTVGGSLPLMGANREGMPAGTFVDGYVFDVGASWTWGDLSASLTWLQSVAEGDNTLATDDRRNTVQVSSSLILGLAVAVKGSLFWMSFDDETDLSANNFGEIGGVVGLVLRF